jgi:hypothetical protein
MEGRDAWFLTFAPFIEAMAGEWSHALRQRIVTPEPGRNDSLTIVMPTERMMDVSPAIEGIFGINPYHRMRLVDGGRVALLVHDSSPVRRGDEHWPTYWRHDDWPGHRAVHCRPCRPR